MTDLVSAARLEIDGTSSQENDFFSPNFEWNKTNFGMEEEIMSRCNLKVLAESNQYIKRLIDYRQEYYRKRSQGQPSDNGLLHGAEVLDKKQPVCIKLSKP